MGPGTGSRITVTSVSCFIVAPLWAPFTEDPHALDRDQDNARAMTGLVTHRSQMVTACRNSFRRGYNRS